MIGMPSGLRFHVLEKGDREDPPVVCIHGLLGSSRNLFRLVESIAGAGFRALAYDQRGHGHSEHAEAYSLNLLARDALEVMDANGIEQAHLLGHSLGARVALAAALLAPHRVSKLCLLDAGTKTTPSGRASVHAIIDPLPDSFTSKAEADAFLSAKYPLSIKLFLASNLRDREGAVRWNFDLSGIRRSLLPEMEVDQSGGWSRLTVPTLILRGERSDYFSDDDAEAMRALNPGHARVAKIPNAGHWLHVDNFQDTSRSVIGFLKDKVA